MSKLKVCGNYLSSDLELLATVEEQIDYIGFIFTPVSKRMVRPELVEEWMKHYSFLQKKAVGVFLNQELEDVMSILQQTGIKYAQLHGEESPVYCQEIRERADVQIWKVFSVEDGKVAADLASYRSYIDHLLLDTKIKGVSGGTGVQFDWRIIPGIYEEVKKLNGSLWIAGGITPENVGHLLQEYPLDGIDLASGVEGENGKDREKLMNLLKGMKSDGNE
ncbi:phosphoribosylanthranilate isomerase [Caldalkalibacillus mannanilyticus]|uniref:phosphoribosylanthranilate isomerase n=1 Tax=Caldalkalibacillus mannanilyticus TaxID=1418 RepID=UPI00046A4F02|nr:phosphoribosylanthranilate isomerase [Caldalkalibacillus mannanilyticus]